MVQLPTPLDPTKVKPLTGSNQLPISDSKGHVVIITGDKVEQTSGGQGQWMLILSLQVVEGPSAGESGVIRLNLGNASPKAVEMATRELSSICHVVGWMQPLTQTEVLHNKKFRVVVGIQEKEAEKGYTEVKKILDVNGNAPGEQGQGQANQGPAPGPIAPQAPQQAPQPPQQPSGFPTAPQGQPGAFPTPQATPQVPQQFAPPPQAPQYQQPQPQVQPQTMAQPQQYQQPPQQQPQQFAPQGQQPQAFQGFQPQPQGQPQQQAPWARPQ